MKVMSGGGYTAPEPGARIIDDNKIFKMKYLRKYNESLVDFNKIEKFIQTQFFKEWESLDKNDYTIDQDLWSLNSTRNRIL